MMTTTTTTTTKPCRNKIHCAIHTTKQLTPNARQKYSMRMRSKNHCTRKNGKIFPSRTKSLDDCSTTIGFMMKKKLSLFLRPWHDAVAKVPISKILPTNFGNASGTFVKEAAWYGDRLIGEQVALQRYRFLLSIENTTIFSNVQQQKDVRQALRNIHAIAVSNQLFADEIKVILPFHITATIEELSKVKVHDAGTMIEAAVCAVSNASQSTKQHEAIANLAQYLTVVAAHRLKNNLSNEIYTRLVTFLNGTTGSTTGTVVNNTVVASNQTKMSLSTSLPVITEKISVDHSLRVLDKYGGTVNCIGTGRLFRATATLNGTRVSSKAHRKKLAKRQAAYSLLVQMKATQGKQIISTL